MPIVDGHYVQEEDLPYYESINNKADVIKEDDGLSCLKYGLRVKYQNFQRDQTASGIKTTIVLQGTYDACKKAMEGNGDGIEPEFAINHSHPTYGNLEQMRLSQDEGPLWNLELIYTTEINWLGISTSKGSSYGKTSSELNCRMQSMPLESNAKYRYRWNYNLYATDAHFFSSSDYAEWFRNDIEERWKISGRYSQNMEDKLKPYAWDGSDTSQYGVYFAWAKSVNELPDFGKDSNKYSWYKVKDMLKPRSRLL